MKRRDFIKKLGSTSLLAGSAVAAPMIANASNKVEVKWKMVTTWPKNFPGLGTGANYLAKLIGEMSGGRIQVKVYGAKNWFRHLRFLMPCRVVRLKWVMARRITGRVRVKRHNSLLRYRLA